MVKKISLSLLSLLLILGFIEFVSRQIPLQSNVTTKLEELYLPPFPPKNPDYLRVLVLGGSSVQGLPAEKIGFVAQLDDQLRHILGPKRNIEIYNLGWSGYNSTMVRYSLSRSLLSQPDLVVVYTGENEFIYSQLDAYEAMRLLTTLKNKSFFIRHILASRQSASAFEPIDFKRPPYRVQFLYYQIKMWLFRHNLNNIVKLAHQHQIPLVLVTTGSNIKDWPPVDPKVTNLSHSLPDGQNANLLFTQGRYLEAKDWDLIPWRASTDQNNFIRSLEDKTTTWVADAEKAYMLNSIDYLPGFNFTTDNVHPSREGAYLIVQTIIDLLKTEKMVKPDWWDNPLPMSTLPEFLTRVKFTPQDEFELDLKTARYAAKNPFFNLKAAHQYLDSAETINKKDWRSYALRAVVFWLDQDTDSAKRQLHQAELLFGGPLDLKLAQAHIPYIEEFLKAVK